MSSKLQRLCLARWQMFQLAKTFSIFITCVSVTTNNTAIDTTSQVSICVTVLCTTNYQKTSNDMHMMM